MSIKNLTNVIERLKEAVKIDELIREDGIELKQQCAELVGYHSNKHGSESKTSLHVDPDRGLYHCFNCGEGGDIISCLRENSDYTFLESVKYLAKEANVEVGIDVLSNAEEIEKSINDYKNGGCSNGERKLY